ncbi:MAG: nucleotide exchange factor GrpE [Candidatus Marinimicrobia bacterium]|nr:nucleotide exchange factor GrpE [Candidatus Neomarinimicrobiota bacterium]
MVKKSNKSSKGQKKTISSKKTVEDLKKQISSEIEKQELQIDKYKRLLAEFDNYKRRTIKEKAKIADRAVIDFSKEIITVVDDFDRTLESLPENAESKSLVKGIELIHEKIIKILIDNGVKSFNSLDKKFDPEIHEAISSQEDSKKENGIILNEYLKGYKFNDNVIRHSKVVVVKNK